MSSTVGEMGEEAGNELKEVVDEIQLKGENHSGTDFLRMEGSTHDRISPPLNSIKELNMVRCSWGSVVPSYSSRVPKRRKPFGKGANMINSEK